MTYDATPPGPASMAKQRAIGRRLRLHVVLSASAGAAASMLSAVLIAYAIIDIERRSWAQWFYFLVYGACAITFAADPGVDLLPNALVRATVAIALVLGAIWGPSALGASGGGVVSLSRMSMDGWVVVALSDSPGNRRVA